MPAFVWNGSFFTFARVLLSPYTSHPGRYIFPPWRTYFRRADNARGGFLDEIPRPRQKFHSAFGMYRIFHKRAARPEFRRFVPRYIRSPFTRAFVVYVTRRSLRHGPSLRSFVRSLVRFILVFRLRTCRRASRGSRLLCSPSVIATTIRMPAAKRDITSRTCHAAAMAHPPS